MAVLPTLQRCVALHKNGDIDLVAVPGQPTFDAIDTHSFFTAQQFYCNATPQLRTSAAVLMTCCQPLIERVMERTCEYCATRFNG